MKTITREYKVYKFNELSESAQDKAIENLYDINIDYEWWDFIYDEANQLGFRIKSFDDYSIEIDIIENCEVIARNIIKNHGESCSTYIEATAYLKQLNNLNLKYWFPEDAPIEDIDTNEYDFETGKDQLDNDFICTLKSEYLSMLEKDYEYLTSHEAIIETIEANDYDFTEDGKLF